MDEHMSRLQAALLPAPAVSNKPRLTSHRLAHLVLNCVVYPLALVTAALFAPSSARAAGQADELEKAVAALRATAPGSEARKYAGQRVCQISRGPLAVALWTADGSLVCRLISEARQ